MMAASRFNAKYWPAAIADFTRYRILFPKSQRFNQTASLLAQADLLGGYPDAAIALFQSLLVDPDYHAKALMLLVEAYKRAMAAAKILQKQAKWAEIGEMFQEFVQKNPDHPTVPSALFWIGRADIKLGKVEEEKQFLATTAKKYLNDPSREAVDQIITQLAAILSSPDTASQPTASARILNARSELARIQRTPQVEQDLLLQIAKEHKPEGGWVVIPIAACSIATIYLIVDGTVRTGQKKIAHEDQEKRLKELLQAGDYVGAYQYCKGNPSPLNNVIRVGVSLLGEGKQASEEGMLGELSKENSKLQTWISYLSVIGVCSPMIGLLGTVTGMIRPATLGASGIGDPSSLSSAIGEVLVATASGLFTAIRSSWRFTICAIAPRPRCAWRNRFVSILVFENGEIGHGPVGLDVGWHNHALLAVLHDVCRLIVVHESGSVPSVADNVGSESVRPWCAGSGRWRKTSFLRSLAIPARQAGKCPRGV